MGIPKCMWRWGANCLVDATEVHVSGCDISALGVRMPLLNLRGTFWLVCGEL